MKKIIIGLMSIVLLFSCVTNNSESDKKQEVEKVENSEAVILDNFVGSYCKGNYVWGLAMNLAWQELNNEILHEKMQLNTNDEKALQIAKTFNKAQFSKKDLDKKSYYIKAGYGQKTVNIINKESRKKFPKKSFKDLDIKLSEKDIISYAYFLKEVEYRLPFYKKKVNFLGEKVDGFYAGEDVQKDIIRILDYKNDDKFILKIELKNEADEIIFAKGYDMKNPQAVLDHIAKSDFYGDMNDRDVFEAPNIHLNYHRDYSEVKGKALANKKFTRYEISQMFENIKFDLDEKGARVENEAVIAIRYTSLPPTEQPKPRHFKLDKAYWIIMKQSNSSNPYFVLGVNNTELMETRR